MLKYFNIKNFYNARNRERKKFIIDENIFFKDTFYHLKYFSRYVTSLCCYMIIDIARYMYFRTENTASKQPIFLLRSHSWVGTEIQTGKKSFSWKYRWLSVLCEKKKTIKRESC